jgi:predicted DNA-binding transcriptional regulator AlpA
MNKQILIQGFTVEQFNEIIQKQIQDGIKTHFGNLEDSQSSNTENKYLTRRDVIELLSISYVTLHDWCKKGILNSYRIGNRVYFRSEEISYALKPTAA